MRHAFHRFITNQECNLRSSIYKDISASHLADYTRYIVLSGNADSNLHRSAPILELMMNSSIEISEEINFFNWLERNIECASNVRKMPAEVFEKFVDKYISENNKTKKEKQKLLKSYQQTGWEALLEEFKVLFRIRKRRSRNMSEVIERYSPHYGIYKCIILPRLDEENQQVYHSLIDDSWEELNTISGDNLDIYYSEVDTGKTGVDIAKRINSLPETLQYKAPCLIIWKTSMQEAEDISIDKLKPAEIVTLIQSIAGNIQSKMNFKTIIKEARNKVKELQDEKKPVYIKNDQSINVSGIGHVVGGSGTGGIGNVSGSSNTVTGNKLQIGNAEPTSMNIEEFKEAKSAILDSDELDEDMKAQLVNIMETAKASVCEQSLEKEKEAKTAFGYVKSFLVKLAPNLLSALGSIATIATYFKI